MRRLTGLRLAAAIAAAAVVMFGASSARAGPLNWPWSRTTLIRAPFELPFGEVGGLATSTDGSTLYIGAGPVLLEYSSLGIWERTWSARFGRIGGVATDRYGDVYVADAGRGQVDRFDEHGNQLATWNVPGLRGIAVSANGNVYLLASVGIGMVVDVRSYAGFDRGAWSAQMPGSWFPGPGYLAGNTLSVNAIATDAAGDVYLTGMSRQRLEGEGPDCHSVFEDGPEYVFAYDDPLDSSEVVRDSSTGEPIEYGWNNWSVAACYPGWSSTHPPSPLDLVAPNGVIWLGHTLPNTEVEPVELHGAGPGSLTRLRVIASPCYSCEGVYKYPPDFVGPGAADCHGNVYLSGEDGIVTKLVQAMQPGACESPPGPLERARALEPAITITPRAHKKGKALHVQVACTKVRCSIHLSLQAKPRGCSRGRCLHGLVSRFITLGFGAHSLTLKLTGAGAALLGGRTRVLLTARLVHGHRPYGPLFRAAGGQAFWAQRATPITLSCPTSAALGSYAKLTGTLGIRGPRRVTIDAFGQVRSVLTHRGTFSIAALVVGFGERTSSASFAGDSSDSPASASCLTRVPAPGARRVPPPPKPTEVKLECRQIGSAGFSGQLTPALVGETIEIKYTFFNPARGTEEELVEQVKTSAGGAFTGSGPEPGLVGKAQAAFGGGGGFEPSASLSCSFS